jgi:hypothetical protein
MATGTLLNCLNRDALLPYCQIFCIFKNYSVSVKQYALRNMRRQPYERLRQRQCTLIRCLICRDLESGKQVQLRVNQLHYRLNTTLLRDPTHTK